VSAGAVSAKPVPAESGAVRAGRRLLNGALNVYAALALAYLLLPVAITRSSTGRTRSSTPT
jgi:hypothetical protein